MTPEHFLKCIKKGKPNYGKFVNRYYSEPHSYKIPDYCFMPMEMWVLGYHYNPDDDLTPEKVHKINERIMSGDDDATETVIIFSHVATWSYSKSIYRFNKELFDQLKDTKISGDIPMEVFRKIPEYCVYIETPDLMDNGDRILGFWAMFHCYMRGRNENLTIVLNKILKNGTEYIAFVPLISVEDGKSSITTQFDENKKEVNKQLYLSLLLYICSENCEYSDTESSPQKYKLEKVKGGFRYIQPSQFRIRKVGFKIGETISKFNQECREIERSKKRPHMRRAHWHGYWIGKRNSEEREFKYNWIPPTFINNTQEEGEMNEYAN